MRNALAVGIACVAVVAVLVTAAPSYDRYGGWTALQGKKTGYFHPERIGGRWWLVTPDGNAFFSKGVCHIAASPENTNSPPAPTDPAKWAAETARLLKSWNFNTVGAWSSPEMYNQGMAYTVILGQASAVQRDAWLKGIIPDYFSPEFRQAAEQSAARHCAPRKNDPWLLGYFTDNELRWGADWRSKESLLESYLRLPETAPGRRKAEEMLKAKGRSPVALTDEDRTAFVETAAAEYARITSEAIRKHDPNHMVIGCRFAGYAPAGVLEGVGRYFDVVSYNNYSPQAPLDRLREITAKTGKPVMVTEFSFKAMDSGLPNTKGAAKPVATQQDRADGFAGYVEALASLPGCVGFHWFQYRDQPEEGRRLDGENSNYGVVKLDLTPWEVLTKRMTEVNERMESLAANAR